MPRHIMICVSGFSGTGKDEFTSRLVKEYGATQTGLADPAKRHLADLYGFTELQLFGPSKFRNSGDIRFPKNTFRKVGLKKVKSPLPPGEDGLVGYLEKNENWWEFYGRSSDVGVKTTRPYIPLTLGMAKIFVREGDPEFWLSPREALQLYCEQMNNLDINTWIRKGVADQKLIASGSYKYSRMDGLTKSDSTPNNGMADIITCFADFRHIHEMVYVRDPVNAGTDSSNLRIVTIRIKRPGISSPPYDHRSETEQTRIRDAAYDFIVNNDSSVEELHNQADEVMAVVSNNSWTPNPWKDEYVLPDVQSKYEP